jgi:hypothetical protein
MVDAELAMGHVKPCKWYISARRQPNGSTIRVNQIPFEHTSLLVHNGYQQ